jgi:hypothetical protein
MLGLSAVVGLLAWTWYGLTAAEERFKATAERLSSEIRAHIETKRRLEETEHQLKSERDKVGQQSTEISQFREILRKYDVPTLRSLEAKLQAVKDAEAFNPGLGNQERIKEAEMIVGQALKEIARGMEKLREANGVFRRRGGDKARTATSPSTPGKRGTTAEAKQ